jgi:hypothetical protein
MASSRASASKGYFVDKMNFSKQELAKIEEQEAALLHCRKS